MNDIKKLLDAIELIEDYISITPVRSDAGYAYNYLENLKNYIREHDK